MSGVIFFINEDLIELLKNNTNLHVSALGF